MFLYQTSVQLIIYYWVIFNSLIIFKFHKITFMAINRKHRVFTTFAYAHGFDVTKNFTRAFLALPLAIDTADLLICCSRQRLILLLKKPNREIKNFLPSVLLK
jgi:hypothetical protein